MLSHVLWATAIAFVAFGVVALFRSVETLRDGLAGYLAAGTFGIGALHGLQWATWAYVDVRAAQATDYNVVRETVIVPFGAGHLLTYGIILGTGVAFLAWALRRAWLIHHYSAWTGVILGASTVVLWVISLMGALGGGDDGHILFDIATLSLPLLYLWVLLLGVGLYRRGTPTTN